MQCDEFKDTKKKQDLGTLVLDATKLFLNTESILCKEGGGLQTIIQNILNIIIFGMCPPQKLSTKIVTTLYRVTKFRYSIFSGSTKIYFPETLCGGGLLGRPG